MPNDPWVLKEQDHFRMWFTRGDPTTVPIRVSVHEATSVDGKVWDERDGGAVFEPADLGGTAAFDDIRTETPAVARLGDTYHLYYSGCGTANGGCTGPYALGHATSADGTHWTRDPLAPVVIPEDGSNPFVWGIYTTAEPGVTVKSGVMYLYYVSARSDVFPDGDGGYLANDAGTVVTNRWGILLATSRDGRNFVTHAGGARVVVLEPPPDPLRVHSGYSTPAVLVRPDGAFELYVDVVTTTQSGGFIQAGLARAVSSDGVTFGAVEPLDPLVFNSGLGDWKDAEVNGPCVVLDGTTRHIWFGGHSGEGWEELQGGIGYATEQCSP